MFNDTLKATSWTAAYFCAIAIDQNAPVPLGTLAFVLSGVWWLGRKLQRLEDRQNEMWEQLKIYLTLAAGQSRR